MNRRRFIRNSATAAAAFALSPALSAGASKREKANIASDSKIITGNAQVDSLKHTIAVSDAVLRPEHPPIRINLNYV